MNTRILARSLILGSLLIGSGIAHADQPLDEAPATAAELQQRMQQQLQQRLDQRLADDMNARFGEPGTDIRRLAESEQRTPSAVQLPQSMQQPQNKRARPRLILPTQLEKRFRHNGASFI